MPKKTLTAMNGGIVDLNPIERIAMEGLVARDQQIQQTVIIPLQQEFAGALRAIEERMGLESGALGATHQLDFSTMQVRPISRPEDLTPEPIADVTAPEQAAD